MACARLAQEHNAGTHWRRRDKIAPDQLRLRRAAAYLCTIQLVADLVGFTRSAEPGRTGGCAERNVRIPTRFR